MLTEKEILNNKEIFLSKVKKYSIFNESLLNELGEELFISPSHISEDFKYSYPGGLIEHIIQITTYMIKLNNLLPESKKIDDETIIKTVFLSQIGKCGMFKVNSNEWAKKNGKFYEYSKQNVILKYNERSLYMIQKYNISISESQYQAISMIGKNEENMLVIYINPLTLLLKQAYDLSVIIKT